MIDTLKLRSPYLTEVVAQSVERACEQRKCTDLSTGEIRWEFVKGQLAGSYDHRVGLVVERYEHRMIDRSQLVEVEPLAPGAFRPLGQRAGLDVVLRKVPVRVPSRPYLTIEGSVHKQLVGHNVFGGPEDLQASARWFIEEASRQLGVSLPPADDWIYRRVDLAEGYDLGSFESVAEYVSYLHNAKFPRRKTARFEDESISIAGTTSTVKLYHKGPEFQVHDRSRLRRHLPEASLIELQQRANMILRVEVEVKAKTLDDWFPSGSPAVASAEIWQHIKKLYNRDLGRTLREGASAVQIVRTAVAVKRRLYDMYSPAMARAAYSTWLELSSRGDKAAAECISRKTFYRHRKALVDAGCSWHDGDVKLDQRLRLVPEDFTPQIGDPRRLVGEDPIVAAALAPYRVAS